MPFERSEFKRIMPDETCFGILPDIRRLTFSFFTFLSILCQDQCPRIFTSEYKMMLSAAYLVKTIDVPLLYCPRSLSCVSATCPISLTTLPSSIPNSKGIISNFSEVFFPLSYREDAIRRFTVAISRDGHSSGDRGDYNGPCRSGGSSSKERHVLKPKAV